MSYEGEYPTVLKKLFPPYRRLLVHMFLLCISKNKGGLDQLNQIQTSSMVALVNNLDYNFSVLVFDNMKRMLENPKKKIFMLYPHFVQMMLDEKYPELFVGVAVKPEVETENLVTDDEGTDSDVELIESKQAEVPVRELPLTNSENLAALIESLKDSLGNPPLVITAIKKEQAEDDVTEDIDFVQEKRVETESSIAKQVSPNAEIEPVIQAEPEVAATAQENVILDFFEMSFPKTTTRSAQESSSGIRFEVGCSSSGGMSEQEEHLLRAAEKMKVFEDSNSDDDVDVDVVKLQNRAVVLEQDSILKDAQIALLQAQVSNKDQVIDELQSDVNMLMSMVSN
ncbi:hypothetical protein Hdeb2414_s0003g00092371 [Helianthus debilis subsp. tardiflorus]